MRKILCAGGIAASLALAAPAAAEVQSWNKRTTVAPGETVQIQTMYNINENTCDWQKNPPVPELRGTLDHGTLKVRKAKAVPHQCPEIEIDAHLADYVAGNTPGTDKFTIFWRSTEGNLHFRVRYVVQVK
ncbi:hypothetical protein [Roseovarius salinarum]|uniref:hypothetical protein n=1 Tax=Roseovarius salinarum TaxID=1981892 RepID=UPI001300047E|nr:hypothetical protein [Roseovarius salinarum]